MNGHEKVDVGLNCHNHWKQLACTSSDMKSFKFTSMKLTWLQISYVIWPN